MLMKLSRIISWAMIFALLLKYLDSLCGCINNISSYKFPLDELIIISMMVNISYEITDFAYLFVIECMFLGYLLLKLEKVIKI